MKRKRNTVFGILAVVVVLVLGACSSSDTADTTTTASDTPETTTTAESGAPETTTTTTAGETIDPNAPVLITWWSHWANEPSKRAVIEQIAADYEAENPNVDIVLTWWDKNPLRDAVRSTMTAGQGAPDITTFDDDVVEWVEAGWLVDLEEVLPWENFQEGTKSSGTYPDLGFSGNYKYNIGSTVNYILYNKEIFADLGITVPDDYQFTQGEFLDVVKTCDGAGYSGLANAVGNRPYPGLYPVQYSLFNLAGAAALDAYNSGQTSWDTPEVRQVLDWNAELRDVGFWPKTFATMTIDEYHVYFHTQKKACMIEIGTWYSGRAFKPVEEGGQDPNFQFGMLRYPLMDGATNPNAAWASFESGYAVLTSTPNPDVAKDILVFAARPKYGALWTAVTNIPSVIKYDQAADWPSDELQTELGATPGQWDWYWEEFATVYGDVPQQLAPTARCGDFNDAIVSVLNEGFPLGLISVDDAIKQLDAALCNE
ncbi:MAG: extracellular solute-binding protein [Proteobacteria bacterium]|nr:extracellular solute-binding protein [Pseudomonadota bacterium]